MPVTSRTYAMSTTTIGALILRDAWACCYCGRVLNEDTVSSLVFDHVIPRGRPGSSSRPCNIVVACQACNIWKADLDVASAFGEAAALEATRRTSIYIGLRGGSRARELRRAGRKLGDRLYPWAVEYRARDAEASLKRWQARQAAARAAGIERGPAFPFGLQEISCKTFASA